jgi:hypothetical protein
MVEDKSSFVQGWLRIPVCARWLRTCFGTRNYGGQPGPATRPSPVGHAATSSGPMPRGAGGPAAEVRLDPLGAFGRAASRALWDLKTPSRSKAPGATPLNLPRAISRGVLRPHTPSGWGLQQPSTAQRNRPFFSKSAPPGHGQRCQGAPGQFTPSPRTPPPYTTPVPLPKKMSFAEPHAGHS